MCRSIEASVVDLPLPVGPVTRIRPLGAFAISASTGGRRSSSKVPTCGGITRMTTPNAPRCRKMLTRKRPPSGSA